jgi:hypothetical protein
MHQLRPLLAPDGALQAPATTIWDVLIPPPTGIWSGAALRLLATLLTVVTSDLLHIKELHAQPVGGGKKLRDVYCGDLGPLLVGTAQAATASPPLATLLVRCGFGPLALQLACETTPGRTASPPWVSVLLVCSTLCLGSLPHVRSAAMPPEPVVHAAAHTAWPSLDCRGAFLTFWCAGAQQPTFHVASFIACYAAGKASH